jgi:hypothetical protein
VARHGVVETDIGRPQSSSTAQPEASKGVRIFVGSRAKFRLDKKKEKD